MHPLAERIAAATKRLEAVTGTPRLDAELLLSHALGWSRAKLLGHLDEAPDAPGFDALLARRLDHEPLAYIFGTWEFFSLEFLVRPPILVPRPETEHLVECALDYLAGETLPPRPRVLDLCTGTGCVALAIAKNAPHCAVTAADLDPDAVTLAEENTARLGLGVALRAGDLFDALEADVPPFDVIVSNPPYVENAAWDGLSPVIRKHEDPRALLAGDDGLEVIRRILPEALARLRPGALLALEIGETQHDAVREFFARHGYVDTGHVNDLAGYRRIVYGKRAR